MVVNPETDSKKASVKDGKNPERKRGIEPSKLEKIQQQAVIAKLLRTQVAHTMETWQVETEPNDPASGDIVITLSTFGIPEGHGGKPEENKFSISLLLVDNKTTLTYDYYIGDILAQFNGMDGSDGQIQKVIVDLELPERLPDVQPMGGSGGGFNADVDDWGDEITTEIPIK